MDHWRGFMGAMALVVAAGAVTGSGTVASAAAGSKVTVQQGGSMVLLQVNDAPCMGDPTRVLPGPQNSSTFFNASFGTLVVIDVVTDAFKPEGFVSSLTSKDSITWTMKLRPNLKFTDGTVFDAAAVKANWDRDRASTSLYASGAPKLMQSVTVVDPQTLQIVLLAANRQFPAYMAYSNANWIVSPTFLSTASATDICNKAVGAGPFVMDSRTVGVQTVFKRNPNYWDKPRPYLDQLTMKINPDYQSSLDTVLTGGADAYFSQNGAVANSQAAKSAKLVWDKLVNSGGQAMAFNANKAPFNDVRARQAVSWALDPVKITTALYPGDVPALTLFAKNNSPYYNPKIKLASNDPKKAQALFDQLAAEGKALSFTITAPPTPDVRQVAQAIQTQLAAYKNVTVNVAGLDGAAFTAALSTSNYTAVMAGAAAPHPEPNLAGTFSTNGPTNNTKFSNPELDQAFTEGRNATNAADAKAAYDKVSKLWATVVPNFIYTAQAKGFQHTAKTTGFLRWSGFQSLLVDQVGFVKGK
jgi:peptide/nickel transport system substrate-binding protein